MSGRPCKEAEEKDAKADAKADAKEKDAELVDTALLSEGAMKVVETMRSAKKQFEEAAAKAADAVTKADTAVAGFLRSTHTPPAVTSRLHSLSVSSL